MVSNDDDGAHLSRVKLQRPQELPFLVRVLLASRGPHMNTVPCASHYLTRAFFGGEVGVIHSFAAPSQSVHLSLPALKAVVSSLW